MDDRDRRNRDIWYYFAVFVALMIGVLVAGWLWWLVTTARAVNVNLD
jgi:hypothetical protein